MNDGIREDLARGSSKMILRVNDTWIDLVRILPGEFAMGSPVDEEGHAPNEEPVRHVRISKPFYLGRFEITRAQYRAVIGSTLYGPEGDDLPVSQINYREALAFCQRLSTNANVKIRLPTEAEWEYACRAGTQTRYCSGSTEADLGRVGWHSGNSDGKAHPVGQKQPNAWGIYDMHGNVWEYCADFIDDYATMSGTDPIGHVTPGHGAMRGGGWMHGPEECRAATRLMSDDMFGGAGFRIALSSD
jgi:formylglycine-generating enzyme required for sulfatase activity